MSLKDAAFKVFIILDPIGERLLCPIRRVLGPQGISAATPSVLHTQRGQGREMGKSKRTTKMIHSYFSP